MTTRSTLFTKFSKDHNPQPECLLFTLPAELRNRIFAIALLSYNEERGIAYYYYNSYYVNKIINTSLLSTCRRIYLETHLVPLYINEHLFWCQPGIPDLRLYFSRLTYSQRCAVVQVHFLADIDWLVNTLPSVCNLRVMSCTKHLKITIRNGGLWEYDKNGRLSMKKNWTKNLVKLKSLETLEVKLQWAYPDETHVRCHIYSCDPSTDTCGWHASWKRPLQRWRRGSIALRTDEY
jgi:hypothetical protein